MILDNPSDSLLKLVPEAAASYLTKCGSSEGFAGPLVGVCPPLSSMLPVYSLNCPMKIKAKMPRINLSNKIKLLLSEDFEFLDATSSTVSWCWL